MKLPPVERAEFFAATRQFDAALMLWADLLRDPHTALALRCVDRLADRTLFLYSGSGGTRVPPELVERLTELRALAR